MPFDINSKLKDIGANDAAKAIFEKYVPGFLLIHVPSKLTGCLSRWSVPSPSPNRSRKNWIRSWQNSPSYPNPHCDEAASPNL
jgi:hypothetical protein